MWRNRIMTARALFWFEFSLARIFRNVIGSVAHVRWSTEDKEKLFSDTGYLDRLLQFEKHVWKYFLQGSVKCGVWGVNVNFPYLV